MYLPPELVDEILKYLPQEDTRSLKNCSVIAKCWRFPCQRRLFEVVRIRRYKELNRWRKAIPSSHVELLQHIRSFCCMICDAPAFPQDQRDRDGFLHDYWCSFRRLARLTLDSGSFLSLTRIETPLDFQDTLTYLCLWRCKIKLGLLVTLVNYFPNLAHLDLCRFTPEVDSEPAPPLSQSFRKLSLRECHIESLEFLHELLVMCTQLDEVAIAMVTPSTCLSFPRRVIGCVGAKLIRLDLRCYLEDSAIDLMLSNCRELRELKLYAPNPGGVQLKLLSSITSKNIRKITFTGSQEFEPYANPYAVDVYLAKLDGCLCQLADRLGGDHMLEVEYQVPKLEHEWLNFRRYLPKFHEKGRVQVVHEATGVIIYRSSEAA